MRVDYSPPACDNQYIDLEKDEKYQRCFLTGDVCVLSLHHAQQMCEDFRQREPVDLGKVTEGASK